jgi:hypothetical protein
VDVFKNEFIEKMVIEAQGKLDTAHLDLERLKETLPSRKKAYYLFSLTLPVFLAKYGVIKATTSENSAQRKLAQSAFLRAYFRKYFKFKGLIGYEAMEVPKKLKRPTLFLTLRYHSFSPFYIYQLFNYPVIVPALQGFDTYKPIEKFPLHIGALLKTISYPDTTLPFDMNNIETLLSANYPVVAHINHSIAHPLKDDILYIYKSIKNLFELDVDIYFLMLENFEQYTYGNLFNPFLMNAECISAKELFETLEEDDWDGRFKKIAAFYRARLLQLV